MSGELVNPRFTYVKSRLLEINKQANDIILETGTLLEEYKNNAFYKQEGFDSFEAAIQHYHDSGQLDFGPRNARYFIAIVELVRDLAIDPKDIQSIGISKLREVASLKGEADRRHLLEQAKDLSVADIQSEARRIRDKANGRDTDPLISWPFKITQTQKQFLDECLGEARRIYAIEDQVHDADVMVDHILPEWFSSRHEAEAEAIEAGL